MIGKLVVYGIVAALFLVGVGAALGDDGDDDLAALSEVELRKDDAGPDAELVDDDQDDQSGDDDKTKGDDGTDGGNNSGDGDGTEGDDGSDGGNNTPDAAGGASDDAGGGGGSDDAGGGSDDGGYVPPAPAPAEAPVYDDYSDDAGYAYGGSGGSDG